MSPLNIPCTTSQHYTSQGRVTVKTVWACKVDTFIAIITVIVLHYFTSIYFMNYKNIQIFVLEKQNKKQEQLLLTSTLLFHSSTFCSSIQNTAMTGSLPQEAYSITEVEKEEIRY